MTQVTETKSKAFVPQISATFTAVSAQDAHYTESQQNVPPKEFVDATGDRINPDRSTKAQAKNKTKPSNQIRLPYGRAGLRSKGYGRILETEGKDGNPRATMGGLKASREAPKIPYWLVDLEEKHLTGFLAIKQLFSTEKNDQTVLEKVIQIIDKFDIRIPAREICQILKITPKTENGNFAFSHFMFIIGNPAYAKKQVNYAPNKYTHLDCKNLSKLSRGNSGSQNEAGAGGDQSVADENEVKPTSQGSTSASSSSREAVFYTGLLLFEMHDTLKGVERLYFNDYIPQTPSRVESMQKKRGFGISDKGFKKIGEAAWDKPLPPVSKISPYLTPVPFVTTRWGVTKPNAEEQGRKRTLTTLQPMHLMIEPPKANTRDPIKITENRMRIREALLYLAAKGDCVALLPDIHFVIHLSDTFVDKLEEVSSRATSATPRRRVYHNNDVDWIAQEMKSIYTPHGLPQHINKLRHLIKYSDGIKLRKICDYIRANQWAYVCNKKLAFRERAWEKMRIDYMPEGLLKTSFINSFVTFLPYISHLPIVHEGSPV